MAEAGAIFPSSQRWLGLTPAVPSRERTATRMPGLDAREKVAMVNCVVLWLGLPTDRFPMGVASEVTTASSGTMR